MKRKVHNEEFYYASNSPKIVMPKGHMGRICSSQIYHWKILWDQANWQTFGQMQENIKMDLIQNSQAFWDVQAVSIGNVVHNRTPIFSKTAVKTKNLGSYCSLKQYTVTEMA